MTLRTRRAITHPVLLVAVAAATLLTACGGGGGNANAGGGSSGSSSPFTDRSDARQQHLVAGAKKEGQLNWYTSLAGDIVQAQVQGFNKVYPNIKVNVFRGAENDVLARATQEAQAGKQTADVTEVTEAGALGLQEAGLTTPFYSPELKKIPSDYINDKGAPQGLANYAADRITYISLGYNKEKIPASAVPKQVQDLLNPAIKGKMSIETSTTGLRWIGGVLHTLGNDAGMKFLQQLSAQQKVTAQDISGAAMMGLIASGEVGIGPAFNSHAAQQKAKGAPVEWIPVQPVIANEGVELVYKKAPHPNAAMLFVDYMLGSKSSSVWAANQYNTPETKVDFKFWSPEKDAGSVKKYDQEVTKWQEIFKKLFS